MSVVTEKEKSTHDSTKLQTRLKNKIENDSTWEGVFYQSESVKFNSSWVIFIFFFFYFMCAPANAFELLCMVHLANNERFLYHSNLSF